jgi:hypothetical protein
MKELFAALVLALFSNAGIASDSSDIPCASCLAPARPTLPEPGFWHDPHEPGSGFTLEVQQGVLAGAFLTYDPAGAPIWYSFSGELNRGPVDSNVLWKASATAKKSSEGACAGCEYRAPDEATVAGEFEFEFLQRALGRYRFNEGVWHFIRPLNFAYAAHAEFAPESSYAVPELDGPWVLVFRNRTALDEAHAHYSQMAYVDDDPVRTDRLVLASFSDELGPVESVLVGSLDCRPGDGTDVVCRYHQYYGRGGQPLGGEKIFHLPLGNITETRFKGEASDGETVEGFRVDRD